MKKTYSAPALEVLPIETNDIIATSIIPMGEGPQPPVADGREWFDDEDWL